MCEWRCTATTTVQAHANQRWENEIICFPTDTKTKRKIDAENFILKIFQKKNVPTLKPTMQQFDKVNYIVFFRELSLKLTFTSNFNKTEIRFDFEFKKLSKF